MPPSSRTSEGSNIIYPVCANQVCHLNRLPQHSILTRHIATYGGHLELSAFAHMTKRNVKVIQPGLVYVIEWDAGGDFADEPAEAETSPLADDTALDSREKRRQRRERLRSASDKHVWDAGELTTSQGTVYVAYVYSSRSLIRMESDRDPAIMIGNIFRQSGTFEGRTQACRTCPRCLHRTGSRLLLRRRRGSLYRRSKQSLPRHGNRRR